MVNKGDDLDLAVAAAHAAYSSARPRSAELNAQARVVLPGGNTRSVLDFAPFPFRVEKAQGAELVDVDGHRYLDLLGNYTAGLLGHSPAAIREAVTGALEQGWAFGAVHEKEVELAELVCDRFPSVEQVRFTNSGTEANLMALGTSLHHTGRTGVLVFKNGYHGGVLSFHETGDPLNVNHDFVLATFNDLETVEQVFAERGASLACVLVEPVQGSGGCIPSEPGFLARIRELCDAHGALLIFDEVMTSRLSSGGAQQRYDVMPDMTTLGKYLAGGMTFGAFGGRAEIMAAFDPSSGGALTQAGTFNNNVVSMTAAVTTLREVLTSDALQEVNDRGDRLRVALGQVLAGAPGQMWATGMGSMVGVHAHDDRYQELFFHAMLAEGYYTARRGFIALSLSVTDEDVNDFIAASQAWVDGFSRPVARRSGR